MSPMVLFSAGELYQIRNHGYEYEYKSLVLQIELGRREKQYSFDRHADRVTPCKINTFRAKRNFQNAIQWISVNGNFRKFGWFGHILFQVIHYSIEKCSFHRSILLRCLFRPSFFNIPIHSLWASKLIYLALKIVFVFFIKYIYPKIWLTNPSEFEVNDCWWQVDSVSRSLIYHWHTVPTIDYFPFKDLTS